MQIHNIHKKNLTAQFKSCCVIKMVSTLQWNEKEKIFFSPEVSVMPADGKKGKCEIISEAGEGSSDPCLSPHLLSLIEDIPHMDKVQRLTQGDTEDRVVDAFQTHYTKLSNIIQITIKCFCRSVKSFWTPGLYV